MTAVATKAPPLKGPKARAFAAAARRAERRKAEEELDLVRWTPEEVIEKQLLPYRSVRLLKEACYKRKVYHHQDNGRITFTPEDIRLENARTQIVPVAA
ncbi:hypothetical protein ACIBEA_30150 [Streptomyces sp. NPDC051555]|uniref:hypothetical protein n=1 Tax=Streptomyces sp. NPDC051555 TaxID=3365657 RepID=UPI00379B6F38